MRVVLLLPPVPPYVYEEPGPNGFRARFNADLARLRAEYPTLGLTLFEPTGYELEDFADGLHLSTRGRQKLSHDFAAWLRDHTDRRLRQSDTRLTSASSAPDEDQAAARPE